MKMLIVTFLIGAIVLFSQSSFVSAQTSSPACIPSTGACIQTGTPHWEFDAVQNLCYQPLAQCGGTKFATELDCQTACITNVALTPTLTPVPTAIATPTSATTITPSPTDPTATPTIAPTPITTITVTPTEAPSCTKTDGDANKDGKTTLRDYEIFRQEYSGELTTVQSDFNCDGKVSLVDFEIFRKAITS